MILNFCFIALSMGLVGCVYILRGMFEDTLEDHSIVDYLKLFYQAIDASFNYVLLKIIM